MGQQEMQELAERLTDDPVLREAFQRDPEAAAAGAGIHLDETDLKALRSEDWSQVADTELSTRVSKHSSWV